MTVSERFELSGQQNWAAKAGSTGRELGHRDLGAGSTPAALMNLDEPPRTLCPIFSEIQVWKKLSTGVSTKCYQREHRIDFKVGSRIGLLKYRSFLPSLICPILCSLATECGLSQEHTNIWLVLSSYLVGK